jgi:hypothetical protein
VNSSEEQTVSQRRHEKEEQKERQTERAEKGKRKQTCKQTRELSSLPFPPFRPINGTFTLVAIFSRATVLGPESDERLEEGIQHHAQDKGMLAQSQSSISSTS